VVDATFSKNACCHMQIWLNAATSREDSIDLPMEQGKDAQYVFPMDKTYIDRVRLKLGDVPGSWVVLHSISVMEGDKVVSELPTPQLSAFTGYSASPDKARGATAYRLDEREAMLDQNVKLPTGTNKIRATLSRITQTPLNYFAGLILLGVFGVAAASCRRRLLQLASVVAVAFVVLLLPEALKVFPFYNDVKSAVSYCAYIGVAKPRERAMLELAGVLSLLVAGGGGYLARRRDEVDPPVEAVATSTQSARWRSRWVGPLLIAAPLVVIGLLLMPDLKGQLSGALSQRYTDSWDRNNFLFWDYLVHRGLVPMKDFFYPYGLQYLFTIDLPWGSVIRFFNLLLFWTYFFVGTWGLLGRYFIGRARVLRYGLLMVFTATFALSGFDLGARYTSPLGVVLLFASIRQDGKVVSWGRVLFVIALAHVALFEIAQSGYALVPVAFLIATDVVLTWRGLTRRERAVRAGIEIATVAIALVIVAIVLTATGQLAGEAFFYGNFSALTSTYAYPAPVMHWVIHPHSISGFDFWAFPLTLALGAYGLAAYRGLRQRFHADVIGLGLIGFMIMQRQVVRDGAETLMWLSSIYGLLVWMVGESSRHRVRHTAATTSLFGAVAALALVSGAYGQGWRTLAGSPARISSGVGALVHDGKSFDEASRTRFAPSRYSTFSEWPVVRALEKTPAVKRSGRVWVLGDAPSIALLLNERWPYYFAEFYDGTPVPFQKRTLHQLETKPPTRVVWNFAPWTMSSDAVPNVIRSPILFQWAIQNLEPEQRVGLFEILRPRHRGERVPLAWWRRRIGTTLDLGQLPAATDAGGSSCAAGSDGCRTYLVLHPTATPQPSDALIPIRVDGMSFTIKFETTPGASTYAVDLDRAWFWSAIPDSAQRHFAATVPGFDIEVRHIRRSDDVLY
jgi:hypothetical protein